MKIVRQSITALLFVIVFVGASAADAPTFSIDRGDVTEAAVIMKNYSYTPTTVSPSSVLQTRLELTLTRRKSAELAHFTTANLGKETRFAINGKVLGMPIIREVITGRKCDVFVSSPDQGVAVAKTLMIKP